MKWVLSIEANQLFLEGQVALSEVEANGCRIDEVYLEQAIVDTTRKIRECEEQIRADKDFSKWRNRYGDKTNIAAPAQLAEVVFKVMGHPPRMATDGSDWEDGKRMSASEQALSGVNLPLVKLYFEAQKLRKGRDTYLYGIKRELVRHADGLYYVHPDYGLNTVQSMRSGCRDPNYQNQPSRNPVLTEIIRRCYVPRPGHQIVEIDYSQQEVRTYCAYSRDPVLIDYVCDTTKDMHRDTACQLFLLEPKQVGKGVRHLAKNQCVFPLFYGSYYGQIAPAVWDGLTVSGAKVEGSDVTVLEHLADHGITELGACDPEQDPVGGTFEHHVKKIEEDFWGNRFRKHAEWKREWIEAYYRDGGCRFLDGFVMTGPHKRNDITNYCNQGLAFHCLLWSMVRIMRIMRKRKMRSLVIGQIHDCLVYDAHPRERDDLIELSDRVMTRDIKEWATWLNVPLQTEPECCPVDAPWFDKRALKKVGGVYVPADPDKWVKSFGPWERQVVS